MDILPNECIYSIFLFLNPKYLSLCGQINNNFNQLYQLDSLWRNQIEEQYSLLFKKKNYYENSKLYYQLNKLKNKLEIYNSIEEFYTDNILYLYHNKKLKRLPKEMNLLINLKHLQLNSGQFKILSSEFEQLTKLESIYFKDSSTEERFINQIQNFEYIKSGSLWVPNLLICSNDYLHRNNLKIGTLMAIFK